MGILAYPYSVRDSANTSTDNRKTGLTPTVSNGHTLAASPAGVLSSTVTVVEIGFGDYVVLYDAETNLDASFPIDWGSGLSSPNDRYGTLILTRDAGRVLGSLTAAGSLPAAGSITSAAFTTTTVNASATGFLEKLLLLVQRFFPLAGGSVTAPKSGNGSLVVRGSGGTAIASQTIADDGTTQTINPAS